MTSGCDRRTATVTYKQPGIKLIGEAFVRSFVLTKKTPDLLFWRWGLKQGPGVTVQD